MTDELKEKLKTIIFQEVESDNTPSFYNLMQSAYELGKSENDWVKCSDRLPEIGIADLEAALNRLKSKVENDFDCFWDININQFIPEKK